MKNKWSSFENLQDIMENWRHYLHEVEAAAPAGSAMDDLTNIRKDFEREARGVTKKFETNDFCKEFPKACTQAYGTQRAQMPQIKDPDHFEKEIEGPPPGGLETNEPEDIPDIGTATKAYLDSSDDKGAWPSGDQVEINPINNIQPSQLKPTQKDIYMDNVLKKVASAENPQSSWKPWNASILVSEDNYLLDGHHRWAAVIVYNALHPDDRQTLSVEKVKMPIEDLLKVANAYSDATGAKRHSGGGTTTESQIRTRKKRKK